MEKNVKNYLLNDILPFWMKHGIDNECGGVITHLDRYGNPYGYDKNVWFAGRTMYTFSLVYNNLNKDPKYLEISENMLGFLKKCELNESGRLPFIVNREGKCITARDSYFSETFAAIGCVEYYLATGREELRKKAEQYFGIAYEFYKAQLNVKADQKSPVIQTKALGPSMIMLSVCQTFRKLDMEKYDAIAKECADEILVHFIKEKGLLENVGLNGEFVDTQAGREVNPGHSLEAAWFLLAEGIHRDDENYKQAAKEIIDISMKLGYRDGGIIAFCDCSNRPHEALEWDTKIWWPQCEAMIANRLCYTVFGEQKYLDAYEALRDYCFSRYPIVNLVNGTDICIMTEQSQIV